VNLYSALRENTSNACAKDDTKQHMKFCSNIHNWKQWYSGNRKLNLWPQSTVKVGKQHCIFRSMTSHN